MRNQLIALSLSGLSIFNVYSADYTEKINKAFEKYNNSAHVRCDYSDYRAFPVINRLSSSVSIGEHLKTKFEINGHILDYKITPNGRNATVELRVDGTLFRGHVDSSNRIQLNLNSLNQIQQIKDNKVGLGQLNCKLEIAYESDTELGAHTHINVHPYPFYDQYSNRSVPKSQELLEKQDRDQLLLLDDNFRKAFSNNASSFISSGGSYFENKYLEPFTFEMPDNIPFKVAPVGHMIFKTDEKDLIVDYTGGNHNYCMWNNLIRVIDAVLKPTDGKTLTVNFHTEGIVLMEHGVKKGGWLSSKRFQIPSRVFRKSNLLSDILKNMSSKQKNSYLKEYYDYFANEYFPAQRHQYFGTVRFIQNGVVPLERTIKGSGTGDYTIIFNYL